MLLHYAQAVGVADAQHFIWQIIALCMYKNARIADHFDGHLIRWKAVQRQHFSCARIAYNDRIPFAVQQNICYVRLPKVVAGLTVVGCVVDQLTNRAVYLYGPS